MHPDSRAALARLAYQRALFAARLAPTPRRWRRLVTTARNVRAAELDHERRRVAGLTPAARALAVGRRALPRRGPVLIPFPSPRASAGFAEVIREWERARALMEVSQRLVEQARGLSGGVPARKGRGGRARAGAPGDATGTTGATPARR
jgi:hypothetical protein